MKFNTTIKTLAAACLSATALSSFAATPQEQAAPQLLSQSRSFINLPTYTPEEKQLVADQAALLLSIYVNRESKKIFYGEEVDAIPRIAEIQANATELSDEELQFGILDIFESQRDLHLNYRLPAPHSCFTGLQLFSMKEIYSPTQNRKAVVSSIIRGGSFLSPAINDIEIGDEVVGVNGKRLDQVVQELVVEGAGANDFGGFNRALQKLTIRSMGSDAVPSSDTVSYTFKRAENGETYELTLPWVTVGSAACIESATVPASIAAAPEQGENPYDAYFDISEVTTDLNSALNFAENKFQSEFNKHFGTSIDQAVANGSIELQPTIDRTINWAIIENRYGNFGYLSISSMIPATNLPFGLFIISGLLTDQLAGTDGLIIDVRDNGGGNIIYAEAIPQMFTGKKVEPYEKRALISPLNELIFSDLGIIGPDWKVAYDESTSSVYSKKLAITPEYIANDWMGQLYFKPVAVLTNGACYSACDLITGGMQDFTDATIWGEDLLTGAGGANVIGFNDVLIGGFRLNTVPGSGIKPLPGGQDMRVAWRQTVRTGESENVLIEDRGVAVDRRVRPTVSDIKGETVSQLDRITQSLKYQAWNKRSSVSFPSPTFFNFARSVKGDYLGYIIESGSEETFTLPVIVENTDRVRVTVNGEVIGTYYTYSYNKPKELALELANLPQGSLVQLEGIKYGEVVWRANRFLRPSAQ